MPWTDPRTWTAAEMVTAAEMNAEFRDNMDYLRNHKGALVFRTTTTADIVDDTQTAIKFPVEDYDSDGFHDPDAAENSKLTVQEDGYHQFEARVFFDANDAGIRAAWLRLNGGADYLDEDRRLNLGAVQPTALHVSARTRLVAGDYVEVWVLQNSGGGLPVLWSRNRCWFSVAYLGL
jgi:hypothetical protein